MQKIAFFLLATAYCLSASSQSLLPKLSSDSSYVTILVNGKQMDIPRIITDRDLPFPTISPLVAEQMLFATDKPFIQNDTTFLYREYSYYQCDTCSEYQLDSSSYYIRPKEWKGYLDHLHRYTYWYSRDEDNEEYFAEAYNYLREKCPVLQHNRLGDIPRLWYPVVKYRGKYYISIDNLNAIELTDSIVVYHDMEIAMSALLNFTKVGKDSYRWQEQPEYFEGIDTVTLRPAKHIKGLYIMSTVRKELGIEVHQLLVPEKYIHRFDFIDWRSSDHIPDGLIYDKIDFDKL